MKLKVIAWMINDENVQQIRGELARIEGVSLSMQQGIDFQSLKHLVGVEAPDALILEISEKDTAGCREVIEYVSTLKGRIAVYVHCSDGSAEMMRRFMHAGVKDFYTGPIQTEELKLSLMEVMSAKRQLLQEKQVKGGITAFLNAKGGGGATTLAVNVAHSLARDHQAKTVLIDFDLQFGAAALSLDLNPSSTIMDALRDIERIDNVFLQALMTKHASGLDVLAAPGDIASIENVREDGVRHILESCAQHYEFVILDMPRVFMPWMVEGLRQANPLMLVVHHDLASIRDAKVILDALPHLRIAGDHVELVNNRAMTTAGTVNITHVKKTLGHERVHRVSNDYETAVRAQESGVPLVEIAKNSDFTRDVRRLADYLVAIRRGESHETPSFFSKWFGNH